MSKNKRYQVKKTDYGCVLTLSAGYGRNLDETTTTHEFWCGNQGYVYETTHRPGASGRQVCETLFGLGSTLYSTRANLAAHIRRLARKHCNAIDKENLHWS